MDESEQNRGDHPVAEARVALSLVVRRMRLTARQIDDACREERLPTAGSIACCELVANGLVVATGEIEKREGEFWFKRGGTR